MFKQAKRGVTLAELLIALAILGVIATFTIPKVLNSSTSSQNTAIFKEAASMVSGAFSAYQLNNTVSTTATGPQDFSPFMNYVALTTVDANVTTAGTNCSDATETCIQLHNGAVLAWDRDQTFTTTAGHYMTFELDPDGSGTTTASTIVLYANGRLTSGDFATGTLGVGGLPAIATDPAYVSWQFEIN